MDAHTKLVQSLHDIAEYPVSTTTSPVWPWWQDGWLGVGIMALGLCIFATHYWQNRWRRRILQQLQSIDDSHPKESLYVLATLLRQWVAERSPQTVQTSGTSWLQQLDDSLETDWFSQGQGQVFGDALYRPEPLTAPQLSAIRRQLQRLFQALPSKSRR